MNPTVVGAVLLTMGKKNHITPILASLHWLNEGQKIKP